MKRNPLALFALLLSLLALLWAGQRHSAEVSLPATHWPDTVVITIATEGEQAEVLFSRRVETGRSYRLANRLRPVILAEVENHRVEGQSGGH